VPLAARLFAPALIDAVTVAVVPAASVPPADDKVTHDCAFVAVQFIGAVPVFVTVYVTLDGENGPPAVPDEVRPPAGVTVIGPATDAADIVKVFVDTLCSPWFALVGLPESYRFPNQATW
jgi:hypothetical protein